MRSPSTLLFGAWLGVSPLLGCSSSKPLGSAQTNAGDAGTAGSSALAPGCNAPGYHIDTAAVPIDQVVAAIRDPSGGPVAELPVQVCGLNQCFTGKTNAAGKAVVSPSAPLVLSAFKYGDGFDFAELAVRLTSAPNQDLGSLVALPLPSYADGSTFPKSGPVTNGGVTLVLDRGATILHDILTYGDDSQRVFRSVPVPVAQSTQALDPSFGFELAYGLAPLGTTFCPPAALRLANTLGWAPDTEVEVFIQGLDTSEKWAPYGTWVKVADASVASDGLQIDTLSGGIPILSSLALRRK